uniref:Uncharacterized protein n=1 Tax=Heterorhabditis bacteriophora TaxID=37862 RepID=A0A1I7WIH7_HETBA
MALQKDLGNSVVLQSENREDRLHLNYSQSLTHKTVSIENSRTSSLEFDVKFT